MQKEKMDAIETKEIRGLSVKNMFTLLTCTIAICITVLTTYFALVASIKELKDLMEYKTQYNDQRFLFLEQRLKALEDEVHKK